ncbi:MAG: glutamine amidotransferase, partial [Rhodosalinus sp.]
MCGIVGLFLKDRALQPRLGALLAEMLVTMTDRGPDSAGIAIYGAEDAARARLVVQSDAPDTAFEGLEARLGAALGGPVAVTRRDSHAVLRVARGQEEAARAALAALDPALRVMS